ncbi:MDR family MFS transporter [Mesorhizobium sp.]|uniref:MDR family MFS transporter n=1 Tax=Mesorhizobium sp. TaxID=1871066 RepID=UPI003BAB5670
MINPFLSSWRSTPRPALLGLLLFFCAGFADGALVPFFPLWASSEASIPIGAIGLLFGCYAGGELLAAPLIGGIADRIGRRPVLVASSLGVGTGFLALFFVHGVGATAVVLLLTGMCESVLHPTILTAIADVTPPSTHPRWFSLARVSSSTGQIVGPACGALLALISLRMVFLAAGGMLLLGGVVMLFALTETMSIGRAAGGDDRRSCDGEGDEEGEGLSALLPAFRDGRLAKLLLWVVLFEVAGNWTEAVIPLYARDAGTLTPSGVGALFAYAAALTVGLQMLVSRIARTRSALWLTVGAGISTIAAFALLAASPATVALIVAVSLCSVAQMLVGPLVPTAVSALSPPARRASYMAASSVAVDLKDSLGPSIGTALYALAPRLPWIAGIPLVAIASLGLGAAIGRARHSSNPSFSALGGEVAKSTEGPVDPSSEAAGMPHP